MQFVNDSTYWFGLMHGQPLSIVDLVANETLNPELAAALWWVLERGASLYVAAGPSRAGKSTLATALLSFLPEDARVYVTNGPRDPVSIPDGDGPAYILVNELSWHTPYYLSGPGAERAFRRLRDGTRMLGALHATSVDGAVEVMRHEAGIVPEDIARIDFVVVLAVGWVQRQLVRRVAEVGLLRPQPDGSVRGTLLTHWSDAGISAGLTEGAAGLLAGWSGMPEQEVAAEVARRSDLLRTWLAEGRRAPEQVAEAIALSRTPS